MRQASDQADGPSQPPTGQGDNLDAMIDRPNGQGNNLATQPTDQATPLTTQSTRRGDTLSDPTNQLEL